MWGLQHLYVLGQRVEDLLGHGQSSGEVPLAGLINDVLTGVVPVEVADGFLTEEKMNSLKNVDITMFVIIYLTSYLESQQVVHCTNDDVHCGCVSCLSPQEILKIYMKM